MSEYPPNRYVTRHVIHHDPDESLEQILLLLRSELGDTTSILAFRFYRAEDSLVAMVDREG